MLKHVGKHNNKKIVVLYRKVPGEDHMCLVIYSDLLPRMYHDEVMKVLESASGQQAENLSDALFRHIMPDGRNTLESLHVNGLIKKVQTEQVTITPNTKSSVQLDELNRLLDEMSKGKDAVKKLAEMDANLQTSKKKSNRQTPQTSPVVVENNQMLDNTTLAAQRREQAERMKSEAAVLLKEAQLLIAEADELDPVTTNDQTTKKSRTKAKV